MLLDIIHPVLNDCRGETTEFLERIISKYGKSLAQTNDSRHMLKKIGKMGKMIEWHMMESEAAARLQEKLQRSRGVILYVYMMAKGYVMTRPI